MRRLRVQVSSPAQKVAPLLHTQLGGESFISEPGGYLLATLRRQRSGLWVSAEAPGGKHREDEGDAGKPADGEDLCGVIRCGSSLVRRGR